MLWSRGPRAIPIMLMLWPGCGPDSTGRPTEQRGVLTSPIHMWALLLLRTRADKKSSGHLATHRATSRPRQNRWLRSTQSARRAWGVGLPGRGGQVLLARMVAQ